MVYGSFSWVSFQGCLRDYDWASKRDSIGDSLSEAQPCLGLEGLFTEVLPFWFKACLRESYLLAKGLFTGFLLPFLFEAFSRESYLVVEGLFTAFLPFSLKAFSRESYLFV